ncbi:hypothetical protein [Wolbachia endosymbiont (group B) of Gerris lacustris]|uniref:hypothetical protein n=1 Tax=Wolbachia endosymbiont (group B) of Gerris lacustris TaxID=3066159 RepID=UPI0033427040
MLIPEKISSANKGQHKGSLEEMGYTEEISAFIDEHERKNILDISREFHNAHNIYNDSEDLPIDQAVAEIANRFLESIRDAKKKKVILSVPFDPQRGSAILDSLICRLNHLIHKDDNIKGNDKDKLKPIWEEVCDLVSKGNYVSERVLKLLPEDVIERCEDYLSNLEKIASESIDNGEINKVAVKRDNQCYFIKYPAGCAIIPTKLLNHPELQDLDGALKIGDGIIRIKDGKYHDIKGSVIMTFTFYDETVEMVLSSKDASGFGKMMVYMNDKNCEIFSKYLKELEEKPHINEIVEAAKSFVQTKSNTPSSTLDNTNLSQRSKEVLTVS